VKTRRDSKNVHFIQLNDGSSTTDLQVVLDAGVVPAETVAKITTGACISVDGELVELRGEKIIIPPGHKQLDFRFTALSFDGGDKARFRYRVDGLDTDWVDVDTRRTTLEDVFVRLVSHGSRGGQ